VNRGDIAIVAYGELGKPRPVIIVQANELGDDTMTIVACPITSELTDKLPIRPVVEPDPINGLRVRSQIMTDRILAVPRERVRQVIGQVSREASERLDRALLLVLGLS
jgi:mRNA interferase MazF